MIRLIENTIDNSDIDNLIDWLKTYPRLTKGNLTIEFEEKWSKWIGCKYSVYVNSGSSANLLTLAALKFGGYLSNNKVVVPGLSWATDLSPVMQLGLEPILCDINFEDLSIDLTFLENIFIEQRPSCLLLVSVLGLVPKMDYIIDLCNKYNVILVGDHCESFGSKFKDKKLGNCGEFASTFSLYFGHHLSTIEGGMVCTNNEDFYDILLMMRSHGWTRDLEKSKQTKLQSEWNVDDFNNLYTFYYPGFNLRSTDLQARLGLDQIDKADSICYNRNKNFNLYNTLVQTNQIKFNLNNENFVSAFAYPYIHQNIKNLIPILIKNNIECRPLICGSMGSQPMYVKQYGYLELDNCKIVDEYGIYLPCHDKMSIDQVEQISNILNGI